MQTGHIVLNISALTVIVHLKKTIIQTIAEVVLVIQRAVKSHISKTVIIAQNTHAKHRDAQLKSNTVQIIALLINAGVVIT